MMSTQAQVQPTGLSGPFFSQARLGRNSWWIYVLTLGTVAFLTTLVTSVLLFPLMVAYPTANVLSVAPAPLVLVVTLLPFAAAHLTFALSLPFLHRRPLRSLVSPRGAFRWRFLLLAGGVWLALCGMVDGIQYLVDPSIYRWSFDAARFWPYLVVALLLLPVQTSAEELVFRGYLIQAFGLRARSLWLPLLAPALLFGLLHIANPEIDAYGWQFVMPQYLGIGLLLGWVTLRSQGLEMALGLHLANNLYTGLGVGLPQGALPSATLFTVENLDPMLNLILIFLAGLIFLAITEKLVNPARTRVPAVLLLGLALGAMTLAGCSAATPTSTVQAGEASLVLEPCLLSAPGLARQVDARCGKLEVPENPADPAGRKISLNVAVIKAQSSNPAPDPIVMLAGGPGQAATEAYLPLLPVLERTTFKRDVVLFDQRGTGKSNPLRCESVEDSERPIGEMPAPEEMTSAFEECLNNLDADPRFYNSDIAMQDLEAIRVALGYEQLNLIGVSYGTRTALTYMRLYPENVRTVVLDAVVPPGWVIGESVRADAQSALDQIFARCEGDAACRAAFPDLPGDFESLLQRLAEQPVTVSVPDPTSGADTDVLVSAQIAGAMVRLISYSSEFSALLPWLVHSAAQGDLRPIASQYLLTMKSSGSAIEQGLFYAVICSEDIPFLPPGGETGDYFFYKVDDYWRAACAAYPANAQPAAERDYPTLQIPALIISGEADPITPPANGEEAARYLPNSLHIVFKGMGHGNLHVGCGPNLVRQLIENASVKDLDTSCIERTAPLPFFLSPIGPQP